MNQSKLVICCISSVPTHIHCLFCVHHNDVIILNVSTITGPVSVQTNQAYSISRPVNQNMTNTFWVNTLFYDIT